MDPRRAGAAAVLAVALAAGCGAGANRHDPTADCSFDSARDVVAGPGECDVTFARGGGTHASALGVDIDLRAATVEQVTLRLGTAEVVLAADGQEVRAGPLRLRVGAVTADIVSVHVSRTR
jgi:hypothetical protein